MQEYAEFDLKRLLMILWERARIILLITVFSGAAASLITNYCIRPTYTASIMLYVNNTTEANTDITSSDVSASQSLVETYITIIQSDAVLDKVIAVLGSAHTSEYINKMMSAGAVNGTEVFKVSIASENPGEAARIANTIGDVVPDIISEIVEGSSVKIIERAKIPTEKSSPSLVLNTAIGLALGFILAVTAILLRALSDTRIKTEKDLENISELPILGSITDFYKTEKAGYGYSYNLAGKGSRLS